MGLIPPVPIRTALSESIVDANAEEYVTDLMYDPSDIRQAQIRLPKCYADDPI